MHTKVVHRAAKLLSGRFSLSALRFNFRGVGASDGVYDDGRGETDDLVAAGKWLRARQAAGPLVVGGFSFGSLCALRAAPLLPVDVLFLIGVPTDRWTGGAGPSPLRRVVWIQGEQDEFSRPETARAIAGTLGWKVLVVPGADHFFASKLDEFEAAAGDALAEVLGT
jgi:alpha/beta superfamily hydrolase